MRALASHSCGPNSIPEPGVTCELSSVLVLIPVLRVFLRVLRFSSLHKNEYSKFQFDQETRAIGFAVKCHPHLLITLFISIYVNLPSSPLSLLTKSRSVMLNSTSPLSSTWTSNPAIPGKTTKWEVLVSVVCTKFRLTFTQVTLCLLCQRTYRKVKIVIPWTCL